MSIIYVFLGMSVCLSVTKSLENQSESNRVFKDLKPQRHGNQSTSALYIPDIPNACLDATYCEYVPNYPEEYITNLLSKKKTIKLFGNKKITNTNTDLIKNDILIESELIVCDYIQKKAIYPRAAKNAQGEWFFILNPKVNPLQVVKQVICRNVTSKCRNIDFRKDLFYNTGVCKQEAVFKVLTSLNRQGNIVFMHFPFMCCCSCYVTHDRFSSSRVVSLFNLTI